MPHDCFRGFLGFSLAVAVLTPLAIEARLNRGFSVVLQTLNLLRFARGIAQRVTSKKAVI
jgi:hypothetical protein